MLIPHSGEESVVISYGILTAKIQPNSKPPNKMKEKDKINLRKWQLHTFAITFNELLKQERQYARYGCHNTADGTNQYKNTRNTLAAKPALETTFVHKDTATAGYLKAICQLLKQALFHKKGVHFFLIGYRAVPPDLR